MPDHDRAAWQRHANFGGPASTLLAIHDRFHSELGWIGRAFGPLATTLHHHHHAAPSKPACLPERPTSRGRAR